MRKKIVPVNRKWPLESLIGSLRELFPRNPAKSHPRHVLIEYVMLRDVNDSLEDAHRYRPHTLLLCPPCTGAGPMLYFFTLHAQLQAPHPIFSPCMHRYRPHTLHIAPACTGTYLLPLLLHPGRQFCPVSAFLCLMFDVLSDG